MKTILTEMLAELIVTLNAECCDALKEEEPWRYYSPPLDGEHEFEHLRSVMNAGQFVIQVEQALLSGDIPVAWCAFAKAQQALLKSLSAAGKKEAKRLGNSDGGKSKDNNVHYRVWCVADDLLSFGPIKGSLVNEVEKKLDSEKDFKKHLTVSKKVIRNVLNTPS